MDKEPILSYKYGEVVPAAPVIKGILTILSLCLVAEVSIELQLSVQWSVTPSVYTLLILAAK